MKNRICPDDMALCRYLEGLPEGRGSGPDIEKHLSDCDACRELAVDAYMAVRPGCAAAAGKFFKKAADGRVWFMGAVTAMALSFFMRRFFWQFLVISALMGMKWILESRTARLLIMINEAYRGREITQAAPKTAGHIQR